MMGLVNREVEPVKHPANVIPPEYRRDHTCISFDELKVRLGMTGIPIRVWVEEGGEYVHMLTIPDEDDRNSQAIAPGGYCEIRTR